MVSIRLDGARVTARRMLLLSQVEFDPGCYVFELDEPLFLAPGDQLRAENGSVVVQRTSGAVERPSEP